MYSKFVRLGQWDIGPEYDCDDNYICADQHKDISFAEVFTTFDPKWQWVDNIALIKLAVAQSFTSTMNLPYF